MPQKYHAIDLQEESGAGTMVARADIL